MNDAQDHQVALPATAEPTSSATLAVLDARIRQLENAEKQSLLARIQKKASFLALLIGIALSCISLFDVFWNKPREALFRDMEEFNKSVNAVANLRQNLVQLQYTQDKPEMVFAMNSMVMPQVLANIQYATALLPRLGDHVGIPQLAVLIGEAMNIYDWKSAEVLVDRAVRAKDAIPTMRSEARRYQGRLKFLTGKIQDGRKAYEESLNLIRDEPAFGINGARAFIVGEWAMNEYAMGDCNVAAERIRQFVGFVQHPEIQPLYRAGLISGLRSQLQQIQSRNARCPVPPELQNLL